MVRRPRRGFVAGFLLLLLGWVSLSRGQTDPSPHATPDNYPPPLPGREGPEPPAVAFEVVREIAVAGPLHVDSLSEKDGEVRVQTGSGTFGLGSRDGAPSLVPRPGPAYSEDVSKAPEFVLSPDGRHRFVSLPSGGVLAAKRCRRCAEGWKRIWELKLPARTPAPPVLLRRRLFVASLDSQVYAVREDNGHRLWASDVEDRVSERLAIWVGRLPDAAAADSPGSGVEVELLLVAPDSGDRLLALDPYDGSRLAAWELPGERGRILGSPVVTSSGEIILGRQGYEGPDASILVLRVTAAAARASAGSLPYNDRPDTIERRGR